MRKLTKPESAEMRRLLVIFMRAVGRLKVFVELMVGHMLVDLVGNCSFQDFAEEGKVGDRLVVVKVSWVQTGFFQNGGD